MSILLTDLLIILTCYKKVISVMDMLTLHCIYYLKNAGSIFLVQNSKPTNTSMVSRGVGKGVIIMACYKCHLDLAEKSLIIN